MYYEKKDSFSVQDAMDQIEKAIENISSNESWLNYLAFQARFPYYSFNNTMLIYYQLPTARYVCGFNRWKEMNRYVRKGEKGIRILAPCRYKLETDESPLSDDDPRYIVKGFKLVSVFDISQTDGSDEFIPILVKGLSGDSEELTAIYNQLISTVIDIPVVEASEMAAKGSYNPTDQIIRINTSNSVLQKIKTLIHEYAHHLHHTKYHNGEGYDVGEIIAESTAYIVASHLSLDTSEYSVPYIQNWCQDVKQLKNVGNIIQKIASEMITKLERLPESSQCAETPEVFF